MKINIIKTIIILNLFVNNSICFANNIENNAHVKNSNFTNKKNNNECASKLNVTLDLDETLFTFLCWMNLVANIEEYEKKYPSFPEQEELKKYLSSIPKDVYEKNRRAYEKFLPSSPLYIKNGLLIKAINFYSQQPNFILTKPKNSIDSLFYDKAELPDSSLIKEFYEKANIHELWESKYKDINKNIINIFSDGTKNILQDTLCYFRMKQTYPVFIRLNTLGYFGVAGQTVFSEKENKFLIKINPSLETLNSKKERVKKFYLKQDLKIVRHEFSHSLFNEEVAKDKYLITDKLEKVKTALNKEIMSPTEELLAQCFQEYDNDQIIMSNEQFSYIYQNVLFLHFIEKLPDFRNTNKSFKDFIPELFKTFDADKEIERWKILEKKYKK